MVSDPSRIPDWTPCTTALPRGRAPVKHQHQHEHPKKKDLAETCCTTLSGSIRAMLHRVLRIVRQPAGVFGSTRLRAYEVRNRRLLPKFDEACGPEAGGSFVVFLLMRRKWGGRGPAPCRSRPARCGAAHANTWLGTHREGATVVEMTDLTIVVAVGNGKSQSTVTKSSSSCCLYPRGHHAWHGKLLEKHPLPPPPHLLSNSRVRRTFPCFPLNVN